MDPARLLKDARDRSNLTQLQVAERAGVPQSTISAYERGKRQPTVDTLQRLLKAAGWQLATDLEPFGADVDACVERALAATPVERAARVAGAIQNLAQRCEGLPFAIDGLAAALIQGVPVEVRTIDVLLADDDDVLATLGPRLYAHWYKVWLEENRRHTLVELCDKALRVLDPSRWLYLFDEFRIRLSPPECFEGVFHLPFGEVMLPVVPLWKVEIEDPAVAAVLARTREILAARRLAQPPAAPAPAPGA